jgi:hypothetical protein
MLVQILEAIGLSTICDTCSKYVFNHCHSKCGLSDCCMCEFQTNEVEIKDDDSEVSFEIKDCFHFTRR